MDEAYVDGQQSDSNECSPDEHFGNDYYVEDAIDEAQELREQLRDVPLGEVKKLKDKVGLKKYNQVLFGFSKEKRKTNGLDSDDISEVSGQFFGSESTSLMKGKSPKTNKHVAYAKKKKSEPIEVSSKKKAFGKPRYVVRDEKRSVRDPRFSDLSGEFNEDLFQKSYSFVNEMKKSEYNMVKKQLKKVKNKEQREDLLRLKQKLDDEQKHEIEKARKREMNKQHKSNQEEGHKAGKKPFYLKKSDQKKIELAQKYRDLKSTGRLEKFMMKKRKKNAHKEKKNLPQQKLP